MQGFKNSIDMYMLSRMFSIKFLNVVFYIVPYLNGFIYDKVPEQVKPFVKKDLGGFFN